MSSDNYVKNSTCEGGCKFCWCDGEEYKDQLCKGHYDVMVTPIQKFCDYIWGGKSRRYCSDWAEEGEEEKRCEKHRGLEIIDPDLPRD